VPTDTPTNSDTPSPIPTDTATATNTTLPTDTPTSTATPPESTPEVTDPPLGEGPTSTPTRTAVEPTGLPTWCYYWNFADGNGGFGLPAQIGAGEWVLGQGWKAQHVTLKSINRTLVQIERTFAPTILTNVDFAYVREEGEVDSEASGIVETLGIFINYQHSSATFDAQAAQLFPFSGTQGTFSWSDSVGVMATSVILESQPSWTNDATATGSSTITAATFRGRGVNPFNAPDNCDLPLTATPTPTLNYTLTDTPTFTQTPTPIGTPGVNCSGDGMGLIGHYHNAAQSFTNEVLVRLDPLLNINWGLGSPETGVVSTDSFTVRWNGYLRPTYSGQHYFRFRVSDGIRMYILLNGEYRRILSKWVNATSPQYRVSEKVLLIANGCYPITIEYFDTNQEAVMEFSWSTSPLVDFTDMASPDWGFVPSVRVYPDGAQLSTPTPTLTPTATPTPTEAALATYHVNCNLGTAANARNFPSGFITSENSQIDGQSRMALSAGTQVMVYELRPGSDGILWARITPYEAYDGMGTLTSWDTLWVCMKNADNVTDNLVLGQSQCGGAPLNLTATPLPPNPPVILTIAPCVAVSEGNDCPLTSDTDAVIQIAFVLACEAGVSVIEPSDGSVKNAIGIAHVIYNRMTTLTYGGSALEVISRGGYEPEPRAQWDCYINGASPSLGLVEGTTASLPMELLDAAAQLSNGQQPTRQAFEPRVNYYGLYTFGIAGDPAIAATPGAAATYIAPYCNDDDLDLLIAVAPFVNNLNATAFFSSPTDCRL